MKRTHTQKKIILLNHVEKLVKISCNNYFFNLVLISIQNLQRLIHWQKGRKMSMNGNEIILNCEDLSFHFPLQKLLHQFTLLHCVPSENFWQTFCIYFGWPVTNQRFDPRKSFGNCPQCLKTGTWIFLTVSF